MSNKKPVVLLSKELIKPIENALADINEITKDLLKINEIYLIHSLYVYAFSIFEVALKNSLEYLLLSIPDKIKSKSFDIEKSAILENRLTQDLIENEVEKYINGLTYKSLKEFFDTYCSCMDICKPNEHFMDDLIERKATRNLLLHNKLEVNSSYLKTAGVMKRSEKIGSKININIKYLEDLLNLLADILVYIKDQLHEKFKEYTSEKVLRDIWSFMFKSPMLNFNDYWKTQDGQVIAFKSEIAEKRMKNLSSSEKTLLSIWLLHFSSSILNRNFSFYDINGWYSLDSNSRNEIILLIEVLNRHPYLLSGKQ